MLNTVKQHHENCIAIPIINLTRECLDMYNALGDAVVNELTRQSIRYLFKLN